MQIYVTVQPIYIVPLKILPPKVILFDHFKFYTRKRLSYKLLQIPIKLCVVLLIRYDSYLINFPLWVGSILNLPQGNACIGVLAKQIIFAIKKLEYFSPEFALRQNFHLMEAEGLMLIRDL